MGVSDVCRVVSGQPLMAWVILGLTAALVVFVGGSIWLFDQRRKLQARIRGYEQWHRRHR